MMQMLQNGPHPGKSSIFFFPMLDLNPGDMSCVYSTLKFIASQAQKNNVTPIMTFDQPLYLKALTVISSKHADSDLSTFHLQMSFLGAIGYLMAGSGLQEIMELVYAPNAVVHILSGKAYARAVRAHLLVDAALKALLLADAFQVPQVLVHQEVQTAVQEGERNGEGGTVYDFAFPPMQGPDPDVMDGGNLEANVGDDTLDIAATVLEKVLNGCMSPRDATREDVFIEVSNQLETHRKRLCGSRTASLWLQYMHMIDIMRKSIKAERTGNFKMHLESVKDMLPFLAAAVHNHYTQSSWLYLQQMFDLKDTHPDVFDNVSTGRYAVRRTDRFFFFFFFFGGGGGLSSDLIIEQVLM